jgi:hypothetical protein
MYETPHEQAIIDPLMKEMINFVFIFIVNVLKGCEGFKNGFNVIPQEDFRDFILKQVMKVSIYLRV